MIRNVFLALSALALAGCATQSDGTASDRDCFSADAISGYSIIDNHNVEVRVGANNRYTFTTSWNARDLDWSQSIAIRSGGSSFICTGNGLGVEIRGGDPVRTYPITGITRVPDPAPQAS